MRLFVAIDLPDSIKKHLAGLQKAIGDSHASIKWVATDNIHLTLKFLGEVEDAMAERVKGKLGEIPFTPIMAAVRDLGAFPSENNPRVVWAGLSPASRIIELQERIDSSLAGLGFPKDDRFTVHITLGRVKAVTDKKGFLERLRHARAGGFEYPLKISDFRLKRSFLGDRGPVYQDLAVYKAKQD